MAKYLRLRKILRNNKALIELLKKFDSMILCCNSKDGSQRTMRFAQLFSHNSSFWNTEGLWDYFIRKEYLEKLLEEQSINSKSESDKVLEQMGEKFSLVEKMKPIQRVETLNNSIEKAQDLLHKKKASSKEISETVIESSLYSALINKVTLEEPLEKADRETKESAVGVFKKTETLMESLVEILSRDFSYSDALTVLDDSTGGVTVKHMARVFIQSMGVLHFIHNQVEYSGLNTRILGKFNNYKPHYERLFPMVKASSFTMHQILMEPIRLNEESFKTFSLGIMLHDIGKKKNIDYFEGSQDYKREIIENHVLHGYRMIRHNSLYSTEVAAIAGMHHEYYGHPQGYGVYRETLKKIGKKTSEQQFVGILSMDLNNILNHRSFAFLPAKILEIIDVYDALIDPARQYKDPMEPMAALHLMKSDMISEELKLDPILFDLFVKYLNQKGELL